MSLALSRAASIVRTAPLAKAVVSRGMATEKQLFEKMTSTKGIVKITSSMKMVAQSKLKGDENRLANGKNFAGVADNLFQAPIKTGGSQQAPVVDVSEIEGKTLLVAISSDKGLCGGVNSYLAKAVKVTAADLKADNKEFEIFIVGDKARPPLANMPLTAEGITTTVNDSWSTFTNFSQVSAIALEVSAHEYDNVMLFYNEFKNMSQYDTSYRLLKNLQFVADSVEEQPMMEYDVEPEDRTEAMESLNQYALAASMYSSFLDQACSFQSSQATAMENATNNGNDVIDALNIQYNRARQARITTELIEIISGASALDG
jgi:F-type H+-transporting ATPase subunit gamma